MNWTNNNILLEYQRHTCKDIFKAVCNEIGSYYTARGYKYLRSNPPRIKADDKQIKLEISFYSSRSNILGDYVNLEILPYFYFKQKKGEEDGFLFGHPYLFEHKYTDDKTKIRLNKIFGEVVEQIDEYSHESKIKDSNNCNVYGLDECRFNKIIEFLDSKVIVWLKKIQDERGVLEFLTNMTDAKKFRLSGLNYESDFVKYVRLNFPDIDIETILDNPWINGW